MRALIVLFLFVALLLIGIGIPLWQQRVPPNQWYGFRVEATVTDARLWYPVNVYTGKLLVLTGVVVALAVLLLPLLLPLSARNYALIITALIVGGTLLSSLLSWLYLRQLSR